MTHSQYRHNPNAQIEGMSKAEGDAKHTLSLTYAVASSVGLSIVLSQGPKVLNCGTNGCAVKGWHEGLKLPVVVKFATTSFKKKEPVWPQNYPDKKNQEKIRPWLWVQGAQMSEYDATVYAHRLGLGPAIYSQYCGVMKHHPYYDYITIGFAGMRIANFVAKPYPDNFQAKMAEIARKCYKEGFVHGDLKTDNILWDRDRFVLIDFGMTVPETVSIEQRRRWVIHEWTQFYGLCREFVWKTDNTWKVPDLRREVDVAPPPSAPPIPASLAPPPAPPVPPPAQPPAQPPAPVVFGAPAKDPETQPVDIFAHMGWAHTQIEELLVSGRMASALLELPSPVGPEQTAARQKLINGVRSVVSSSSVPECMVEMNNVWHAALIDKKAILAHIGNKEKKPQIVAMLKAQIADLAAEIAKRAPQTQEYLEKIRADAEANVNKAMNDLIAQNKELAEQFKADGARRAELVAARDDLQRQIIEIGEQIKELQQRHEKAREERAKMGDAVVRSEAYTEQVRRAETETTAAVKKIMDLRVEADQFRAQLEQRNKEIAELRQQTKAQIEEYGGVLQNRDATIARTNAMRQLLLDATTDNQLTLTLLTRVQNERADIERRLAEGAADVAQRRAELEKEVRQHEESLRGIRQRLADLKSQINAAPQEAAALKARKAELEAEEKTLGARTAELAKIRAAIDAKTAELAAVQRDYAALVAQTEEARKNEATARNALDVAQKRTQELERQIGEKQAASEQRLQALEDETRRNQERLREAQQRVDDVRNRLAVAAKDSVDAERRQLGAAEASLEEIKNKTAETKKARDNAATALKTTQLQRAALDAALNKVRAETAELEKQLAEAGAKKTAAESGVVGAQLQARLAKANSDRDKLQTEKEEAENNLRAALEELEALRQARPAEDDAEVRLRAAEADGMRQGMEKLREERDLLQAQLQRERQNKLDILQERVDAAEARWREKYKAAEDAAAAAERRADDDKIAYLEEQAGLTEYVRGLYNLSRLSIPGTSTAAPTAAPAAEIPPSPPAEDLLARIDALKVDDPVIFPVHTPEAPMAAPMATPMATPSMPTPALMPATAAPDPRPEPIIVRETADGRAINITIYNNPTQTSTSNNTNNPQQGIRTEGGFQPNPRAPRFPLLFSGPAKKPALDTGDLAGTIPDDDERAPMTGAGARRPRAPRAVAAGGE